MICISERETRTKNGHNIRMTFFGANEIPHGKVLLVSAMGTKQAYYHDFATWLAEQGYLVATFDYSGTGKSRVDSLKDFDADLVDWGRFDATAAFDALAETGPNTPLYWIGHSLGGQLLGMSRLSGRVAKAITIGSGGGYWLDSPTSLKLKVWWLWFFVAPIATRLYGYFPGRKLRKVGDIPGGVMRQWRRWNLSPGYAFAAEGSELKKSFESVTIPIFSISFIDDELVSAANVETLLSMYSNAEKTAVHLSPQSISVKRIGHFGFFKPQFKASLWERFILPALQQPSSHSS